MQTSAVGLFCCDKFEETPNEKVINLSKLTKSYFSNVNIFVIAPPSAPPAVLGAPPPS